MTEAILTLFKGYLDENKNNDTNLPLNPEALKKGVIISNHVGNNIIRQAIKLYGKDGVLENATFHKSFDVVRDTPIETLIVQQIMHYFTTYGFEALGIYNSDTVYIPAEKLEIPELNLTGDCKFTVIKPLTTEEIKQRLMVMLTSGIALSQDTIEDIKALSKFVDKNRIDEIKNREVKIFLYDKYNIVPHNPDEFLRYLIFKTTGMTLKIKDKDTIQELQHVSSTQVVELIDAYLRQNRDGYKKLSSIFLRNKPLFLALKRKAPYNFNDKKINAIINKLRKLAKKYHKPQAPDILGHLTDSKFFINETDLLPLLDDVTLFREARILNSLNYRMFGNNHIVYRIRNGKSYISTLPDKTVDYTLRLITIQNMVKLHFVTRLSKIVKNKTVCIPDGVVYAMPTSEKQFNGNIPAGSYIELPRNSSLVYGVHWKNLVTKNYFNEDIESRVDLDLKQMSNNQIFGWDANYRDNNKNILFSGDMTNAPLPDGATELFYVSKKCEKSAFMVTLNVFYANAEVPYQFIVAKAPDLKDGIKRNYMVDPNDCLLSVNMKTNDRQNVIGLITIDDTIKLYFTDFSTGVNRSSCIDDITTGANEYLKAYNKYQLKLNDLLEEAGATIKTTPKYMQTVFTNDNGNIIQSEEERLVDFDLSPESITKDIFLKLLKEDE